MSRDAAEVPRYRSADLVDFAAGLFAAAGMPADRARLVGEILVEADLMGHDTHGLELAPSYLRDIEEGAMLASGEPDVVADRKAAVVWNGHYLSGVWLTAAAIDLAGERARDYGTATVAIRQAHHIACLAAYLPRATARGQVVHIASSNPAVSTVAPHGGIDPVFTPNPFAVGIPTGGDPILIDTSASITTNGMVARMKAAGRRLPGLWARDADGTLTDDPSLVFAARKGSLLLTGGVDHGHKGYGLSLMIESLTQGLSGEGRAERPTGRGASVFVQVYEPEVYAGLDAFTRETAELVRLCRASRPVPGGEAVRLPGERALARRREALANGVALFPGIMDRLKPWADRLAVPLPAPL